MAQPSRNATPEGLFTIANESIEMSPRLQRPNLRSNPSLAYEQNWINPSVSCDAPSFNTPQPSASPEFDTSALDPFSSNFAATPPAAIGNSSSVPNTVLTARSASIPTALPTTILTATPPALATSQLPSSIPTITISDAPSSPASSSSIQTASTCRTSTSSIPIADLFLPFPPHVPEILERIWELMLANMEGATIRFTVTRDDPLLSDLPHVGRRGWRSLRLSHPRELPRELRVLLQVNKQSHHVALEHCRFGFNLGRFWRKDDGFWPKNRIPGAQQDLVSTVHGNTLSGFKKRIEHSFQSIHSMIQNVTENKCEHELEMERILKTMWWAPKLDCIEIIEVESDCGVGAYCKRADMGVLTCFDGDIREVKMSSPLKRHFDAHNKLKTLVQFGEASSEQLLEFRAWEDDYKYPRLKYVLSKRANFISTYRIPVEQDGDERFLGSEIYRALGGREWTSARIAGITSWALRKPALELSGVLWEIYATELELDYQRKSKIKARKALEGIQRRRYLYPLTR